MSSRFRLALEQLPSTDWRSFETLALQFLAAEYPMLRSTASQAGDGGRDGELFSPEGMPDTGFQFSVRKDWAAKIGETRQRLAKTFPEIRRIIYVTNQEIGASADKLRAEVWDEHKVLIDVLDISYFLDRQNRDSQRRAAAEELAAKIVDPFLSKRGVANTVTDALEPEEGKLALLHLTLSRRDGEGGQNLTKSCFDSLVLSTLHGSTSENVRAKEEIVDELSAIVTGPSYQIQALVDSALGRLSVKNGPVMFNRSRGGYHIAFQESLRLNEETANFLLGENALEDDLLAGLYGLDERLDQDATKARAEANRLKHALEMILMKRGESFADAISSGEVLHLDAHEIGVDLDNIGHKGALTQPHAAIAILRVLEGASAEARDHLRRIIDAYTLLAFLRVTPDVQKTMSRIFSDADIWLDTSAVLPLLGEILLEDSEERHYTNLLAAARATGMNLFITDGVVEEVASHLKRCEGVSNRVHRGDPIEGQLPFIYAIYVVSGRDTREFGDWLLEIRGSQRPEEDVRTYLKEVFGIERKSLREFSDNANPDLRAAVQELWYPTHDRRRDLDQGTKARLVAHDVENTVGVIEVRRQSPDSPMGYRAWWLTLDRTAFRLKKHLISFLGEDAPASPALSPDFLLQLLRLRPLPAGVEARTLPPIVAQLARFRGSAQEVLNAADQIRQKHAGMSERLIRREVRDGLDTLRGSFTPDAEITPMALEERLKSDLETQRSAL
ncbi:hypothetical protein ASH00_02770 [Arthrobacter sp. Soil782]|uniref:hypothetical protein n=1 Tax=Arthrobacter sp. Soil782 TaxID=1736410 RepID=UPI0006FA60E7|nr:hypothetical protein [Arthrobacter sp. Soil782]KRF08642.1 hypothetical protein ASH00_02770 [Arthrobacter sp. Soil782]